MKAIELFAGIGGFRLACDQNEIATVFANDLKEKACLVALLGSLQGKHIANNLAIISDDAGQFNVLTHGLCWVSNNWRSCSKGSSRHSHTQFGKRNRPWQFRPN